MKLHRLGATEGRTAPQVPTLSPDRPDGLAIWVGVRLRSKSVRIWGDKARCSGVGRLPAVWRFGKL